MIIFSKNSLYLLIVSFLVSCAAFERSVPSEVGTDQPKVLKDKYKIEPVPSPTQKPSQPVYKVPTEQEAREEASPIFKVSKEVSVGERYVYSAGWSLLNIGEIHVEVLPLVRVNGRVGFPIKASGKTNKFFSAFYNAIEDLNVVIDAETLKPYKFELVGRESRYTRHQVSIFDYDNKQAYFWRQTKKVDSKEGVTKEITYRFNENRPYTDSLSPIFSIRSSPLFVGKKMTFRILESAHIYLIKCQIMKEESKTSLGHEIPSYYFECEGQKILSEGGKAKAHEEKRKMLGWISKEKPHYVLEAKAAVKIGSVSISLIDRKMSESNSKH